MNFSFKAAFFCLACVAGLFVLLYFGRPLLIPLSTALLLAFILYPLCKSLEAWGLKRMIATMSCLLSLLFLAGGISYLFSRQIVSLAGQFSDFQYKLFTLLSEAMNYAHDQVSIIPYMGTYSIMEKGQEWLKESGSGLVTNTFAHTASVVTGLVMVVVFTFLLLIYRRGLTVAVSQFASTPNRKKVFRMIYRMQKVGKQYVFGMAIMIGILGIANSLALLLIGIDHAFFFGFMAAVLAIIPYVGTTLGAVVPTVYAAMTHESVFVPLMVVGAFWLIQLVEGNYLSPKIVGGQLNVNALAAIISLVLGGYVWGIAGMALFLPLTAILKVFCEYFEELQPFSALLGHELTTEVAPEDAADPALEPTPVNP